MPLVRSPINSWLTKKKGTSVQIGSAPLDCHGESPRWQTSELKLAVRARRWGNISIQQAPLVTFTSTAHDMVLQLATQVCDVMTLSKRSKNGKYVEDNQLCTAISRVSSRFELELLMLLYIPKRAGKLLIGWLFLIGLLGPARCRFVVSTRRHDSDRLVVHSNDMFRYIPHRIYVWYIC